MTEDKRFAGLTNEELIIVHDKISTYLEDLNSKLMNNVIHEKVEINKEEVIKVHKLTEQETELIKASNYYQLTSSIVEKLKPIVDLIKECSPEVVENTYN